MSEKLFHWIFGCVLFKEVGRIDF